MNPISHFALKGFGNISRQRACELSHLQTEKSLSSPHLHCDGITEDLQSPASEKGQGSDTGAPRQTTSPHLVHHVQSFTLKLEEFQPQLFFFLQACGLGVSKRHQGKTPTDTCGGNLAHSGDCWSAMLSGQLFFGA